jgi:hypothetical protein
VLLAAGMYMPGREPPFDSGALKTRVRPFDSTGALNKWSPYRCAGETSNGVVPCGVHRYEEPGGGNGVPSGDM